MQSLHPMQKIPSQIMEGSLTLQEYEPTLDIRPESCICRPCRNEVSDIGSDGFTPRWRKNNIMVKCFVSGCTGTDIKNY